VLSLFGNKITDISPLSKLKNIENIDLGDNVIRDVKPLIGLLKLGFKIVLQMQLAKVDNKRINVSSQIQVETQRNFKVTIGARTISIDSNPLDSPPVEIVMQGSDAIKYFEDNEKQGQDQILRQS
jgi:Leucine-rich repeat (LRR) protein